METFAADVEARTLVNRFKREGIPVLYRFS